MLLVIGTTLWLFQARHFRHVAGAIRLDGEQRLAVAGEEDLLPALTCGNVVVSEALRLG